MKSWRSSGFCLVMSLFARHVLYILRVWIQSNHFKRAQLAQIESPSCQCIFEIQSHKSMELGLMLAWTAVLPASVLGDPGQYPPGPGAELKSEIGQSKALNLCFILSMCLCAFWDGDVKEHAGAGLGWFSETHSAHRKGLAGEMVVIWVHLFGVGLFSSD